MIIPRRRVSVHPNYFRGLDENTTEYDSLLEIAKEFAKYWREGYHQDFGRDKPIEYPEAVKDAGLCKVHVLVFPLSKKDQQFWDSKSYCCFGPYYRSHCDGCDSLLLYAVSEEGTALILALYDQEGHNLLSKPYYEALRGLGEHAKAYFKSIDEQPALEQDLLNFLRTPTC